MDEFYFIFSKLKQLKLKSQVEDIQGCAYVIYIFGFSYVKK